VKTHRDGKDSQVLTQADPINSSGPYDSPGLLLLLLHNFSARTCDQRQFRDRAGVTNCRRPWIDDPALEPSHRVRGIHLYLVSTCWHDQPA